MDGILGPSGTRSTAHHQDPGSGKAFRGQVPWFEALFPKQNLCVYVRFPPHERMKRPSGGPWLETTRRAAHGRWAGCTPASARPIYTCMSFRCMRVSSNIKRMLHYFITCFVPSITHITLYTTYVVYAFECLKTTQKLPKSPAPHLLHSNIVKTLQRAPRFPQDTSRFSSRVLLGLLVSVISLANRTGMPWAWFG